MRHRLAAAGLLLLVIFAGAILVRSGGSYAAQDRDAIATGSAVNHLAGTDALGRDRLVRVAAAGLIGLSGALGASVLSTSIAAGCGLLSAFAPPFLGAGMLLICDACLGLPWLFLLMMVRSALPLTTSPVRSATITFLLLGLLGWPACARAVHAGASELRRAEWALQARAAGLRPSRLVWRYLLPHLRSLLLPQFLVSVPACLMAEANLGTLGLGVSEPLPSWGSMLLELDNSAALASTHWVYLPILLLVGSLVLLELLVPEHG